MKTYSVIEIMHGYWSILFAEPVIAYLILFISFNVCFGLFYINRKKQLSSSPIGDSLFGAMMVTFGTFLSILILPIIAVIALIISAFALPIFIIVKVVNKRSLNLVEK